MSNNYTVQMNTTEVDIDTFNDEKRSIDPDREIKQECWMMKTHNNCGQIDTGQGDREEVGTWHSHEQGMIINLIHSIRTQGWWESTVFVYTHQSQTWLY